MFQKREPIITHAEIVCWAEVGDLGFATVSFDDFQWGTVNNVEEIDEDLFTLSPNPSCDFLNINLVQPSKDNDTEIMIFNTIGQEVYSGNYTSSLDTSMLPKGQYLLRLTSGRNVITKRFIIQR